MNRMVYLFAIGLLLLTDMQAQAQALPPEANSSSWLGHVEVKCTLGKSSKAWGQREAALGLEGYNGLELLKYAPHPAQERVAVLSLGGKWKLDYLNDKLFNTARYSEQPLYKDRACAQPLSEEERWKAIHQIDTICCTPVLDGFTRTYDTSYIAPHDIPYYKVFQTLYYDSATAQLKAQVHAIAPVWVKQMGEELLEERTLFWLPVQMKKTLPFDQPTVTWAVALQRDIHFNQVEWQRQTRPPEQLIQEILRRIRKEKMLILDPFDAYLEQPLPLDQLEQHFDAASFEEVEQRVGFEEAIEVSAIQAIRWYQVFFWDEEAEQLFVQSRGFFPLEVRRDDSGALLAIFPKFFKPEKAQLDE